MKLLWSSLAAIAIHTSLGMADENRNLLAVSSPAWLANVATPTQGAVVTQYPKDADIKAGQLPGPYPFDQTKYPKPLQMPPTDHPEVQAVLKQIDWSKVPQVEPRKIVNYFVDTSGYDNKADPDCWWSASTCKKPKLSYIPEDIYACPKAGQWGLNYDDGPLRVWSHDQEKKQWEEPRFYNFMVEHGKQKATLFFIGSNVITYPEAAQRALNDGHTICAHTWSHKQMTSLTNEQIVAELYWTHKAIKEVMGITPKCWRPPYGDVDDRVRSIAHQMGMRTIIWDQDSNDWNLYGTPARGKVAPEAIDKHFQDWISKRVNNLDNEHGHIVLQHENSNSTVSMAERWLPKIQSAFDVMPIHQCLNDPYPYWEQSWAYPTVDNPSPPLQAQDPNGAHTSGNTFGSSSGNGGQQSSTGSTTTGPTSGAQPFLSTFALYLGMVMMTLSLFA